MYHGSYVMSNGAVPLARTGVRLVLLYSVVIRDLYSSLF